MDTFAVCNLTAGVAVCYGFHGSTRFATIAADPDHRHRRARPGSVARPRLASRPKPSSNVMASGLFSDDNEGAKTGHRGDRGSRSSAVPRPGHPSSTYRMTGKRRANGTGSDKIHSPYEDKHIQATFRLRRDPSSLRNALIPLVWLIVLEKRGYLGDDHGVFVPGTLHQSALFRRNVVTLLESI